MKKRKMINYEDIVEIGLSLIKEETDLLYGESENNKAESAMRICGIVNFIKALDEATILSESDVCENPDTSIDTSISKQPKFKEAVIAMSDEDWANYLKSGLKGN